MVKTVIDQAKLAAKEIAQRIVARAITRTRILSPADASFKSNRVFFCFIGGRGTGKTTMVKALCEDLRKNGHQGKHIAVIGSNIVPAGIRRLIDAQLVNLLHRATSDDAAIGKFGLALLTKINEMCVVQGGPVIMNIHGDQIEPIRRAVEVARSAGYETKLVVPVVSLPVVHERVRLRSKAEGRPYVAEAVTRSNAEVTRNVKALAALFDRTFFVDNNGSEKMDFTFLLKDRVEPVRAQGNNGRPQMIDERSYGDLPAEALTSALPSGESAKRPRQGSEKLPKMALTRPAR